MRQASAALARLVEEAQDRQRIAPGQIVGQLSGTQVAPATPGNPGVVDPDDILSLSDATPAPLGAADPGDDATASRGDHIHPMPTPVQVGAEPALGSPGADGYVLSSTAGGVRSWVAALADPTTTEGDLLYRGPVSLTRLGVGAAGQFLGIAGGIPAWAAVSWADVASKPATFPPEAHTQAASTITDLAEAVEDIVGAAIKAGGSNVTVTYNDTTGETTISVSLQAHASSHASGGSDPISPSSIGAVATGSNAAAGRVAIWESGTAVGGDSNLTWTAASKRLSAGNVTIEDAGAEQAIITKSGTSTGALIDINPIPTSPGYSLFRFFRTVNTTGAVRFDVHRGNNTAARNASIAGSVDDSFVCAAVGNFGVGTETPGYKLDVAGDINARSGQVYRVNGTQVLGARRTGWAAATGTATRTTFATDSVTLIELARRVKALTDDLIATGVIGA